MHRARVSRGTALPLLKQSTKKAARPELDGPPLALA